MDTLTAQARSERMRLIRDRDTKPEISVRRLLHGLGYRFRLQRRNLPGRPDIVLPRHHCAIFVHGCFWHRHTEPSCRLARMPKSRVEFWEAKLAANQRRDIVVQNALEALGWRVLLVWECQLADKEQLKNRILRFLEG